MKRRFKTTSNDDTTNKVGKCLIRGLNALSSVSTPTNIRSSFWHAGLELSYLELIPSVTMNALTWLHQKNLPNSDEKDEYFSEEEKKKKKRTKTVMKGLTEAEKKTSEKTVPIIDVDLDPNPAPSKKLRR